MEITFCKFAIVGFATANTKKSEKQPLKLKVTKKISLQTHFSKIAFFYVKCHIGYEIHIHTDQDEWKASKRYLTKYFANNSL